MIDLTLLILFTILPSFTSQKPYCNQTCSGNELPELTLLYPFGFSSGCGIRLNCSINSTGSTNSTNSTVLIGEFPVKKLTGDEILVSLPAKCGRPIRTLHELFTEHFAPTSDTAILLQNCTGEARSCIVPETAIESNVEVNCGEEKSVHGNVSCYSDDRSEFVDYDAVVGAGCGFVLSGMVVKVGERTRAVSVSVQVVKLGWWLKGPCRCANDAVCTEVVSPVDGGAGYRCRCKEGFDGDGYEDSNGCRKVSRKCNFYKFLFGHCGGSERAGVLVGVIAIGGSLMASIGLVYCSIRHRTIAKARATSNRRLCKAKGITIPVYPYKEVKKATNGFSDKQKLGTGGYGTVYKAKIRRGEWVAVKRIYRQYDGDDIDEVMNEIILLSTVSHTNLVRLLGCSFGKDDQILIYEFMPNGTLSEHLQKERGNGLPWPVRLTIATEIAQAISYLHSSNPPIYHRDIKSCNILLDYNFTTKVADFGLSRLGMSDSSHVSTAPRGTLRYLDPQYHQSFHLTDKSDVYSFGVVLVEIITALKAMDFSRPHSEVNLASLAVDRIGKGNLEEIIDPFLKSIDEESTLSSIRKVAEVAFRCLAFESDMRPPMIEVTSELEQIRASNFAS